MTEDFAKSAKSICTFCQTPIKNEDEEFLCPSCSSPYHHDCWEENKGCAVYGCGEKKKYYNDEISLNESIINIEYLINRNQFSEAIIECKHLLKLDKKSAELKNLYNRAVSLINNKINLITSADEAFNKKDYKSAEIYYKNVLKYADEVETNFINARLEISKEKIPEQKRRKIYQNVLVILLILAILSAIGYLGYYAFVLKEDRDYTELVKSDNAKDLKSMESMLGKYEFFLKNYPDGKYKKRVIDRINQYSFQISNGYYKDDWRTALRYYNKFSKTMDTDESKVLKNNIYNMAFNEYRQKIANAKKLNAASKYSEALNELNNAMNIIHSFPDSDIEKESSIVEANMLLLNKKISSIVKINDIDRELKDKDRELNGYTPSGKGRSVLIEAKVLKFTEPDMYLLKESGSGDIIALRSNEGNYVAGQLIKIDCIESGKIKISDEKGKSKELTLYLPYFESNNSDQSGTSNPEKEALYERVKTLKTQKAKIDSLLKMNLM